jgi:xenotropic and polytropic retrovirus receptor 1
MDWSLLQPHANKRFLRDVRGFKNPFWYYLAMFLDPVLRFNWVFYGIYTQDLQHSTLVSFLVGLSEVSRRGMWTLFRVENEHCANVTRFKAFRDVPLPYELESSSRESLAGRQEGAIPEGIATTPAAVSPSIPGDRSPTTAVAVEPQVSPSLSFRRRPTLQRTFTKMMADAHTQDFEKKWNRTAGDGEAVQSLHESRSLLGGERANSSDEDEDEDEHSREDLLNVQTLLREGDLEEGEQ